MIWFCLLFCLFLLCGVVRAGWLTFRSRRKYGLIWAGSVATSIVTAIWVDQMMIRTWTNSQRGHIFRVALFLGVPTALIGLIGSIAGVRPSGAKRTLVEISIALMIMWFLLLVGILPVS